MQRTTIEFPFPISATEIIGKLLVRIAKDLNSEEQEKKGSINYWTKITERFHKMIQ